MQSPGWLLLLLAVLLAGGGLLTWTRAEGSHPRIDAPEAILAGAAGTSVDLAISDAGSGLRALRVDFVHAGGETALVTEDFPGNLLSGGTRSEHGVTLQLDPGLLGSFEGEAILRVTARDWSWRGGFDGNESVRSVPLRVDLIAPRIEIATGLSYARQGGSGSVSYRLSEPVVRDGVLIGERFYRGFPRPGGSSSERIALFAIPSEASPEVRVAVIAEDAAGNASRARWPLVVQRRAMPNVNVTLNREFLEKVIGRFAGHGVDAGGDPSAAFDDINTRVRAENEARIRQLLADSSPEFFQGAKLEQMRNSKVTSTFGERRAYFFEGRKISNAVHFGYDLASFAAAPVTAAASGRVIYAGDLGIYGNCLLVDHGLGLATLYGHLSRLDVASGDRVEQGQRLGLSGDTGLAGGDHLHFAVLVGDTYVDPIEWWDVQWVRSHITPELQTSRR
ncbi:MAG: M23 family metallopeptidase [Myxococcales bacterium]|nr:M23 family metallopeptidase [Myxococcales bacterium]MDH5565368.1 M23 family metallopeptidase [Myxococcales bacterium]